MLFVKMAQLGMYVRVWIYLCALIQTVYPLVNMELQVLQFDNPLGTSYTRDNVNSGRKCCDAGGSDCRSTSDKCDVYFIFCFGSYDLNSPGCHGASIDMQQEVSTDVLKLTASESKKLYRTFNVTNWNDTGLIVQVLDIDSVPTDSTGNPHVFPDLIDSFKQSLHFSPAPNYWNADTHVISMTKHTSLDIQVRAWCAHGWFGVSCDQTCTVDNVHECTESGRHLDIECTDPDILVLNFKTPVNTFGNSVLLQENITRFLASEVCPSSTSQINATVKELREKSDDTTDVIFIGYCDNTPISNLKMKETIYVMNQVITRLTPVKYIFGVAATPPYVKSRDGQQPNIIMFVRIVNYVNMDSQGCSYGNSSDLCNPIFTVSFSWTGSSIIDKETILLSNNLTDCNGRFIDVDSRDDKNAKNSTVLFLLNSPGDIATESINVNIKDLSGHQSVANHKFLLSQLRIGSIFYDAQPYRFSTSAANNTRLTVEVIAWCANCYTGSSCQISLGPSCNKSVTKIPSACQYSTDCMNGGTCIGETCHCNKGWIGPTCNVDVDECAIGVCTHAQSCTNTRGGYSCTCAAGFTGNNCDVDIDECSVLPCGHGKVCVNTFGSYVCLGVCTNNEVGPNCTGAVDFCVEQPCANSSTCVSGDLNFTCVCAPGWQGSLCKTDVNECENTTLCQNGGTCNNTVGSFQCMCPDTYTGTYCEDDVDECLLGKCLNNATCNNTWGGFTCSCTSGFTGSTCSNDINECLNNPCVHSGQCTNSFGGYSCGMCEPGWEGKNCENDKDECLATKLCANNGTCINTPGSFYCNCTERWTGHHCHKDVDECSTKYACNYHGQCNNTFGGFQCSCYSGWDGLVCDNDIDECLTSPCQNGGVCNNTDGSYICECSPAWNGPTCSVHVDECNIIAPCKNGGTCSNTATHYLCACPNNWTGENCTDDVDECLTSPCKNGGICNNTDGSYRCDCTAAWSGITCNVHLDECNIIAPCKNGGTCSNTATHYTCSCPSTWIGENCTDDFDECFSGTICSHGGTCINTIGSYQCVCPPQWNGTTCDQDVNECLQTPCKNNGFCKNNLGSYSCDCTSAWTGANCTVNVNECLVYDGICNHGVCNDTEGGFTCSCVKGYQGTDCSADVDECQNPVCQNGGTCENIAGSFICHCPKEWKGNNCTSDYNECNDSPCLYSGTCTNTNGGFTCACIPGRTGQTCEQDFDECAHSMCKNGASCDNTIGSFVCTCAKGYEGNTCSVNTDECLSVTCENGGNCQDLIGDFKCICQTGYTGTYCKVDINDCDPNPCQHGGLCHDHVGYYECVCPPGWQGKMCYTDVDECKTRPCKNGEACTNTVGSYTCNAEFSISPLSSTLVTPAPSNVDVFSLQFTTPVSEQQRPSIKDGIVGILKLLDCHDSSYIHVALVHNSVAKPNIVEFYAQCDGHHLTNREVNKAIRTLSKTKLEEYFPNMELASVQQEPKNQEQQSWIASHTAVVGGAAGGVVVLVVVITAIVCIKRKRSSDTDEPSPYSNINMEVIEDMDGTETLTIRNPVYESMYKPESVS